MPSIDHKNIGTSSYVVIDNTNQIEFGINGSDSSKVVLSAQASGGAIFGNPIVTIDGVSANADVVLSPNGTGSLQISTLTQGSAVLSTTGVISSAVSTNGQVLLGVTGAAPSFGTLTSTGSTIAFTPGAGSLNLESGASVPVSFSTQSGSAVPAAGVLTITGAGTVTTSGAGSTVTITGSTNGILTWSVITGATQAMAVNNGYVCNNAGTTVATLPGTAAVGDLFAISGMNNATGWQIAQNANQIIHFGTVNTTTGVGGSLTSTNIYDTVHLVCNVANLEFIVLNSVGNITVV